MKAAVYRSYGPPEVVHVAEVPTPRPKADEVLIRIAASTVASADMRARSLRLPRGMGLFGRPVFGFFSPRKPILGTELSGTVAEVGRRVTRFRVGDRVCAFPGFGLGCHAEYRTMRESACLTQLPDSLDFATGAALAFGGTTALHFLRGLAKLRPGESLLVVGAAGTVGSAAVQLGRHFGARVAGLGSAENLELIRGLGCEAVYDRARPLELPRATFDVIFDTVGAGGYPEYRHLLKDDGRLLLGAADLPQMLAAGRKGRHRVLVGTALEKLEDLELLRDLAASGVYRPLIDRSYPLAEIAAAHAYVDGGRKRGSVVVLP